VRRSDRLTIVQMPAESGQATADRTGG